MAVSAAMSGLALASVPLWEDSCNGSAPFLQKQDLPAEIKMKFQPHEILESGFLSKENFQVVPYDIDTLLLNASNVDQSFGLAKFVSEHNKIRLNHLKADTLEADSATKVKIVNKQKKIQHTPKRRLPSAARSPALLQSFARRQIIRGVGRAICQTLHSRRVIGSADRFNRPTQQLSANKKSECV